mmetsp:Transcript_460/g.1007  ORF Transcript_460/g.1007 Transcript_460/m.1007 type:complete len:384 (-) Transcript_460:303-1454(-)|eukprot:CAMPEP_0116078576 /NCGR_PEP_ID=MMETSP0327-20121206/681_1 /TAXON_ID=44447 /ORGANISM="Pseudo-nitzschia delicatissima, Strain B596" /LENGTH=383 /DNA_ID=CAMNT_0003569141 /DNA_START=46 /DNA_END=1197 /DNA_ORIENTATION=+
MVVIVGAGIVGTATAYYLSSSANDIPITILDAVGPAAASSGKAGAFLTNRPPSFVRGGTKSNDKRTALFEKSFDLHQQLADELDLESYCKVKNYQSVNVDDSSSGSDSLLGNLNGTPLSGDAALVDPSELVSKMMQTVLKQGGVLKQATMEGLEVEDSCVTGIRLEGDNLLSIDQDEPIVIALGPWAARIEDWLGIPMPIEGVLSTSLIYEKGIPETNIGSAYFFDEDSNGCHLEIFGRKDKSLYVSGCGESKVISTRKLRSDARPCPTEACPPDLARAAAAQQSLEKAGYNTTPNNPTAIQACIRPVSPDAMPIVGRLLQNVYVATGGGPWGITWGPLMGQSLASLILEDDDPPIRLASLGPKRFDTFVYKSLLKSRGGSNE